MYTAVKQMKLDNTESLVINQQELLPVPSV